jgi:hypothetical protein
MILLLLGWNLALLGVVTVLLGCMTGELSMGLIFGAVFGAPGLLMSFALRKTCPSFRSDVPERPDPNRPLDYY